jgi:hypothetical protein
MGDQLAKHPPVVEPSTGTIMVVPNPPTISDTLACAPDTLACGMVPSTFRSSQAVVRSAKSWAPVVDWDDTMSDAQLVESTITMESQSVRECTFAPSFTNCQNITINFNTPRQ